MKINPPRWPTLVLLVFLSGCATLGSYREGVRVSVYNIEFLESTMMEQLYAITLRIQNRNDQALTLKGGSFDLEINGKAFGSGVTDTQTTIPPYADAKIEVRMVSTLFGILRLFQSFQDRADETLDYEISGRLSIDGALGGISFEESGEISLPAMNSNQGRKGI